MMEQSPRWGQISHQSLGTRLFRCGLPKPPLRQNLPANQLWQPGTVTRHSKTSTLPSASTATATSPRLNPVTSSLFARLSSSLHLQRPRSSLLLLQSLQKTETTTVKMVSEYWYVSTSLSHPLPASSKREGHCLEAVAIANSAPNTSPKVLKRVVDELEANSCLSIAPSTRLVALRIPRRTATSLHLGDLSTRRRQQPHISADFLY